VGIERRAGARLDEVKMLLDLLIKCQHVHNSFIPDHVTGMRMMACKA
jgi:hypothetical protein